MNTDETPPAPAPVLPQEPPSSPWRHFKRPLKVTGITLGLALVLGIGGTVWIHRTAKTQYQATERAKTLGQALAFGTLFVIFPFWMFACGKVGEKRRAARLEAARRRKAGR